MRPAPDWAMATRIAANGFTHVRQLPTGEWAGMKDLVYNLGVYVGLQENGVWSAMFAFDSVTEAHHAIDHWNGTGFPPGYKNGMP